MRKHSEVDVITNSSSTVYIWTKDNAIEKTKDLLMKIVSAVGFEGDIDEYFEVDYILDSSYIENLLDDEEGIVTEIMEEILNKDGLSLNEKENEERSEFYYLKYKERDKYYDIAALKILEMYKKGEFEFGNGNEYEIPDEQYLSITVKPKNGEILNLWREIGQIFSYTSV